MEADPPVHVGRLWGVPALLPGPSPPAASQLDLVDRCQKQGRGFESEPPPKQQSNLLHSQSRPLQGNLLKVDIPKLQLNSGNMIPAIGFGTWKLEGSEVKTALQHGYRLIDTAKIYNNEHTVGRAISDSGVSRGDIFLTTKLWPSDFVVAAE